MLPCIGIRVWERGEGYSFPIMSICACSTVSPARIRRVVRAYNLPISASRPARHSLARSPESLYAPGQTRRSAIISAVAFGLGYDHLRTTYTFLSVAPLTNKIRYRLTFYNQLTIVLLRYPPFLIPSKIIAAIGWPTMVAIFGMPAKNPIPEMLMSKRPIRK